MKILVGVDGSLGSFAAVDLLSRLTSSEADDFVLYYSPPQVDIHARTELQPEVLERVRTLLTDAVFEAALQHLPGGVRAKTHTVRGTQQAAQGLLLAADEYRADMIALGARGASTLRQVSVGSVTRHVVHSTRLPVLVARTRQQETSPRRVLLASDGSDGSRHAGQLLHQFQWPRGSVGHVATVVESLYTGHIPVWLEAELRDNEAESVPLGTVEASAEEVRRREEDLTRYVGKLPAPFQGQDPIVSRGNAAQQILDAIDAQQIDLVVAGARRLGGVERFFVGSTSEHILTHAPCSVLIVRDDETP